MCNCSKKITYSECQELKQFAEKVGKMHIYHVSDEKGLLIAFVPPEKTPNQIAFEREFLDKDGNPEWYYVKEHPCLNE